MGSIIEEIYSFDGLYKAQISERNDNNFQVTIHKWSLEIDDSGQLVCPPFWSDITQIISFSDTFDKARKIAEEKLKNVCGCKDFTSIWQEPK
jgi:hypothetical protein